MEDSILKHWKTLFLGNISSSCMKKPNNFVEAFQDTVESIKSQDLKKVDLCIIERLVDGLLGVGFCLQ